jgi:hypothetical protein
MLTASEEIGTCKVEAAAVQVLPRRPDPRVVEAILRKSVAEARARLGRALPRRVVIGRGAHAVVARY